MLLKTGRVSAKSTSQESKPCEAGMSLVVGLASEDDIRGEDRYRVWLSPQLPQGYRRRCRKCSPHRSVHLAHAWIHLLCQKVSAADEASLHAAAVRPLSEAPAAIACQSVSNQDACTFESVEKNPQSSSATPKNSSRTKSKASKSINKRMELDRTGGSITPPRPNSFQLRLGHRLPQTTQPHGFKFVHASGQDRLYRLEIRSSPPRDAHPPSQSYHHPGYPG